MSLESRSQHIMVKASIPAALSVAAYICARIISKRSDSSPGSTTLPVNRGQNCHLDQHVEENNSDLGLRIIGNNNSSRGNLEDKLLELEIHIEGLKKRERDSRRQLLRYQEIKEREFTLVELKNKMMLEKARAEFLLKEIQLVQNESQRMGGLILEYVKLVHQLEESNKEKRLLEWKARKMCKRARKRFKAIREQKLKVEARDEVLLSNHEEIQRKDELIQELEDEISEMKGVIDHLQREKFDISNNLDNLEMSYSLYPKSEIKDQSVTKEEYDKVVKEVEQLQKDREAESNELTYLKWSNACLRHQLTRYNELNHHGNDDVIGCNDVTTISAPPTRRRRRKFIDKVKKWVEGGRIIEGDKDNYNNNDNINNEVKSCFGYNSVNEQEQQETQDLFVHTRISCSSV